jgi:hypothetical protein
VIESGEAMFKAQDERYKKKEAEGISLELSTFNLQP